MTGQEVLGKVKEAQRKLDELNLEVAYHRLACGMSLPLIRLYAAMGRASKVLMDAERVCDLRGHIANLNKADDVSVITRDTPPADEYTVLTEP